MRKYIMSGLALTLLIFASLLGGCNSSNKEGQPASLSTTAGAVSLDGNIQAEITGVTINSPPVVTFRLLDENGLPLDPTTTGLTVRFYIAQLKADGSYANYEGNVKNVDGTTSHLCDPLPDARTPSQQPAVPLLEDGEWQRT